MCLLVEPCYIRWVFGWTIGQRPLLIALAGSPVMDVPLLGDTRVQFMASVHEVRAWIGSAVLLDPARVGSRAHRARLWCTNLVSREILRHAYDSVHRDPTLTVDRILDLSRYSHKVRVADRSPMALVNRVGQPRMALPTLVNYPASHAYRDGGPGLLWDSTLHQLVEPNADERERAMEFMTGVTAASSVSEASRRKVLGQAMDLNCLTWILEIEQDDWYNEVLHDFVACCKPWMTLMSLWRAEWEELPVERTGQLLVPIQLGRSLQRERDQAFLIIERGAVGERETPALWKISSPILLYSAEVAYARPESSSASTAARTHWKEEAHERQLVAKLEIQVDDDQERQEFFMVRSRSRRRSLEDVRRAGGVGNRPPPLLLLLLLRYLCAVNDDGDDDEGGQGRGAQIIAF
ncbi:hypothetical protein AXG93_4079s1050 [Marchantia polymorpha subsp. ruderalis]|uniref:Uncharacterized protein n=1 Tax=Marchantia polymorpha subsp. ruderalis TaxID=1480154 RepID=A0A176VVW6_MARPO|nr:hypothetical protein AXG93_4079s1050 [Marchantia polymorpha subsp. ruderalis]